MESSTLSTPVVVLMKTTPLKLLFALVGNANVNTGGSLQSKLGIDLRRATVLRAAAWEEMVKLPLHACCVLHKYPFCPQQEEMFLQCKPTSHQENMQCGGEKRKEKWSGEG